MDASAWVSAVGAVVSVASALAIWRLNGPRLRVEVFTGTQVDPEATDPERAMMPLIYLRITNRGRAAGMVDRWLLESTSSTAWLTADHSEYTGGPELPARVEPQQSVLFKMGYHDAVRALGREHPREVHRLRGVIEQAGKRTSSRSRILVKDGKQVTSSWSMRMRNRLRTSVGLATWTFPIESPGPTYEGYLLHLGPAAWMPLLSVRVDLVRDGLSLRHHVPVPDDTVIRRRLVLPRRSLSVAITEWDLGDPPQHEGLYIRTRYRTLLGKRGEIRHGLAEPGQTRYSI